MFSGAQGLLIPVGQTPGEGNPGWSLGMSRGAAVPGSRQKTPLEATALGH